MAQAAPSLEELIERLDSLEPGERFEALEALRKYSAHRKVNQAVFLLRNDPDRAVRTLARQLLEDADKRTSESLSVPGSEAAERDLYINELIQGLSAKDPTDRVTALKELRMIDDPRAIAAVDRMRKDDNRIVRMLAEEAREKRLKDEKRPAASTFEGNVMVSSPVSEKPKKEWKEKTAGRLGPELIPWLGVFYTASGLPLAAVCFYLWMGVQGVFDPERSVLHLVADQPISQAIIAGVATDCAGQKNCDVLDVRPGNHELDVIGVNGKPMFKGPVAIESGLDIWSRVGGGKYGVAETRQRVTEKEPIFRLDPAYAPTERLYAMARTRLMIPTDALSLAVMFAIASFQTLGGLGLVFRSEAGRKVILIFHASLFLFGLLLPSVWFKFASGTVSVIIVYYLTRPGIIATFRGMAKVEEDPKKASYGDMERKVW